MATGSMDPRNLASLYLKSRKNANFLVDLLQILDNNSDRISECVLAADELFVQLHTRGDFNLDETLKITKPKEYDAEQQYIKWLTGLYEKFFSHLLILLTRENDLHTLALRSTFQLICAEAQHAPFPAAKLEKVILLALSVKNDNLLTELSSYCSYLDVLFFSWKILKSLKLNEESDEWMSRVISLMEHLKPPQNVEKLQLLGKSQTPNFQQYQEDKIWKNVQKVWMALANRRLSPANHRKMLLLLVESYISELPKPTLLTDFLVGSLSLGGATGLIALQGMSILVTKHNLECPNIFGKLYNMFEGDIFYTKYKARLFYLADLFLQSTHLPEAMVASYAKRLSRLSLVAPASDLVLIMHFVGNLLIRHPALAKMIHSSNNETVDSDPFNMGETDPLKTNALDSSLWEISLLRNHVQPKVAAAAKFLDSNLPSTEWDIRDELDSSYTTLFEAELKKNIKIEPAMTFMRPTALGQSSDDRLYKMWSLT